MSGGIAMNYYNLNSFFSGKLLDKRYIGTTPTFRFFSVYRSFISCKTYSITCKETTVFNGATDSNKTS